MAYIAIGVGAYLLYARTVAFGINTHWLGYVFIGIGIGGWMYGT